ncbi:MAG: IS4 family transposase [Rhodospirillaceae bacterium]|nr:IS4 family transposase [Rhodospirillaceae bacterium]
MQIGLRHYACETVDWLQARLAAGDCTRTFLARELCVQEDWRNAKGAPCLASARAVLPKLSLALGLPLRMLAVRVLEPDAENARRIATWYEKRGLIEEWFAALKVGTRIRDRRLDAADDLQRCLAFDATTACTVMSIERLARSAPETRAQDIVHPDELHVLAIHMDKPDHRRQRGPPNPNRTIAEFVVNTARLAGFIPAKRQPTPGTGKLREGYRILALFVEHHRVMRDYPNTKPTMLQ